MPRKNFGLAFPELFRREATAIIKDKNYRPNREASTSKSMQRERDRSYDQCNFKDRKDRL